MYISTKFKLLVSKAVNNGQMFTSRQEHMISQMKRLIYAKMQTCTY